MAKCSFKTVSCQIEKWKKTTSRNVIVIRIIYLELFIWDFVLLHDLGATVVHAVRAFECVIEQAES